MSSDPVESNPPEPSVVETSGVEAPSESAPALSLPAEELEATAEVLPPAHASLPEALPEDAFAPALPAEELEACVEALLYASPEPLSVKELKKAFPEVSPDDVVEALSVLRSRYDGPGRGLQLVEVAGGFQITTRPEYHDRISRILDEKKPSRLTTQALETLSVIAYRQPATVPEIMDLRGVRSAGVVRTLLEKKFIRIVGRKNVVGRPLLYGTTKEFLLRFGLKDLSELPRQEDFAEIFQDADVMDEKSAGEGSPAENLEGPEK